MGRGSRPARAHACGCPREEVLASAGAPSHRDLVFPALVQVCGPCFLPFLAWFVEYYPTQGHSLQSLPSRCPLSLINSILELCNSPDALTSYNLARRSG